MRLQLPPNLQYPVTIKKILKQVGDDIVQHTPLFTYSYVAKVKQQVSRYDDDEVEVDKVLGARFESTIEGTIEKWLVWEGDVVRSPMEILEVTETCKHSVVYNGMCVECGKDMTGFEMADAQNQANIPSAHDTNKLYISQEEALEVDRLTKTRLLTTRRLSLVVDLDQTIIHAAVDPTIEEWRQDPQNPNYEALQDVRRFQLPDDGRGMRECWYYIKMRPGLGQFLENISEKYELHIYTHGTRLYAQEIANIIDPDKKYFGDRVLSRDESGSAVQKHLKRLFPVDDNMVVIIDDRGDIWRYVPNLWRVKQFEFFPQIGDINAGQLKKHDILPPPKTDSSDPPPEQANGNRQELNGQPANTSEPTEAAPATSESTAIRPNPTLSITSPDDLATREMTKVQEEAINSQLEEKPLLKLQQQLDEKDAIDSPPPATQGTESDSGESDSSSAAHARKRHSILRNDDEELIALERDLRLIHEKFFAEYDRKRSAGKSGRIAALTGKRKEPIPETDDPLALTYVPDVKTIIPPMKEKVLGGIIIVFSSVIALGIDVQSADISMWAKSFGAKIADKVTKDVTHVVANRAGTAKVKTAVKRGIKVVSTDWLFQSIYKRRRLDERPFMLKGIGQKEMDPSTEFPALESDPLDDNRILAPPDFLLSSDEDTSAIMETDDNEDDAPRRKKPKLDVIVSPPNSYDSYNSDDNLPHSPIELDADEWADIDDELQEFLGSDMDSESDAESVRSDRSVQSGSQKLKKRRRDEDDAGNNDRDGESDGDNRNGDHKRVKSGPTTGSRLRAVSNIGSSGHNTPILAASREADVADGYDDDDDELARELERELEAVDND